VTRKKTKKIENGPLVDDEGPTLPDVDVPSPTSASPEEESPFESATDTRPDGSVASENRAGAREGASEPEPEVEPARELSHAHLRGLLEALVFASDKPMKHTELARLASAPAWQVKELLGELKASYATSGIVLDEVAGGWLFRTNAQYAPFVRELAGGRPVRLSRAQVETLAIAAYRQPITRPEIDEIRGVDSGATLKLLLERDLVRILGKKDEPGRPLLYGTTTHFLEFFNMKSLKDLPTLREFTELSDESLRVAEAELDGAPEAPATLRGAQLPASPGPVATDSSPVFGGEGGAVEADNRDTRLGPPSFEDGER
jgi:segregation and condensation protein B